MICEEIVGNIETDKKKVAALSTGPLISYLDSDEERTVLWSMETKYSTLLYNSIIQSSSLFNTIFCLELKAKTKINNEVFWRTVENIL